MTPIAQRLTLVLAATTAFVLAFRSERPAPPSP